MTSKRAQAYGRAMKTLEDLGAAKLHPHEQQTVREAADAMLFCEDLVGDPAAEEALGAFYGLVDHLLESERILPETAGRLTADVEACGPLAPIA